MAGCEPVINCFYFMVTLTNIIAPTFDPDVELGDDWYLSHFGDDRTMAGKEKKSVYGRTHLYTNNWMQVCLTDKGHHLNFTHFSKRNFRALSCLQSFILYPTESKTVCTLHNMVLDWDVQF